MIVADAESFCFAGAWREGYGMNPGVEPQDDEGGDEWAFAALAARGRLWGPVRAAATFAQRGCGPKMFRERVGLDALHEGLGGLGRADFAFVDEIDEHVARLFLRLA